jgi:ABC-2 type transport system permease protein
VGTPFPGRNFLENQRIKRRYFAMHTLGVTLTIFTAAVRKELTQQWRTKRLMVIVAVLVLFGLGTPMLTKAMPDILKSDPQAGDLAEIFPTPTAADAAVGYIEFIGTFGFAIAIFLGMNAIAGEKESGTASLILSKPMRRWVFVLSKFTAQVLVYAFAFLMGGLAVYYCTSVLFGPVDIAVSIQITLLLLLIFLTYASLELFASAVGKTAATAAGIGFGLYFLTSFARNVPYLNQWAPSGVTNLAMQLGVDAGKAVGNPTAIAGAFVFILAFLIAAMVVFQKQEIN